MRFLVTTCGMLSALLLGSCASVSTTSVWEHYDACLAANTPFAAVVDCGKQKRAAYCQSVGGCSSTGNAFVEYADSLAMWVKEKKITEAEAQRRLVGSFAVCRPDKGG
jgi:hypothetical protein